ncbi:dihydrofolate synthase / folylpolyglutamate synthase [Desulfopila aestuarii DSM 18488]|uniref:Dihydrofolate synthase/folylpolyglutamate synthase n=2 Tax=Desulfopila aestuarii TaxID=231440 RepID=A0A1M7XZ46_9BACT|nr:dihydrofolate synthase / folylpolyglutamate synthase [Desulfopila aestuarii DSM 18488]
MNYQETLTFLNNLQMHKIKLGLEAMRDFLAKIGQPEQRLKIIHVAGTNGKGSVSASMLEVLGRAGYRVGLFTSPHLSSVRERFRTSDGFISEEEFARLSERLIAALGEDQITYFEFTTALAFLWFAESNLDLVILETGLGGRLDATNVVTPLVSVITSISMDHEAYLGDTLSAVAGEKAGIIKPGVPVVATGGQTEVVQVLQTTAKDLGSALYLLERDFNYAGESNDDWCWQGKIDSAETVIDRLQCSMRGAYQRENASLVIAVLELLKQYGYSVPENSLREGLASVAWPGRLEYIVLDRDSRQRFATASEGGDNVVRYLLDGAHNPAGVKNLAMTLSEEYDYRKLIMVWGAMIDKDIAAGLNSMLPLVDTFILTRPDGERSAEPEQLLACLPESARDKGVLVRDVAEALREAEKRAAREDMVVVAGSLYLVGAVRKLLVGEIVGD